MLLGIDLGGTKTALALATREGRVQERRRHPTRKSGCGEADLAELGQEIRSLLRDAGRDARDIDCLGVSAPGPLDAERERILHPPNLPGWDGLRVRHLLENDLGIPVRLENDANAAALAEHRFGAGRGFADVVYLTMSTGVGAGLILGGQLHRGASGNAGEFGHICLEEGGALCACGLRGCVEAYIGGASWAVHLREFAPAKGRVSELAGDRSRIAPEHLVVAAREGDAFALAEFERFNHYLARAIANVVFAFDPEVVILGTIPTAAGEELCLAPVREHVASRVWPELTRDLRILPAALGPELPYLAGICVASQ